MSNLPTTRKEAKIIESKFYFTGKLCKNNHASKRWTNNGMCCECLIEYRHKNSAEISKQKCDYYLKNSEHLKKYANIYRSENLEERTAYLSEWKKKNSGHVNAQRMLRHAAKLKRIPMWLSDSDKQEIKLIYKIAARVSKETGIEYHVDHEIPLQGEFVSGLHVPDNLQLLTASENLTKNNRFSI